MNNPENIDSNKTYNQKMGEALTRLKSNPDFQLVILDGYLKDGVLDSVSLLAVPQIKKEGRRTDVMEDLIAASNLSYFFQMTEMLYQGAVNPVLSDDEELAESEAN